MLYRLWRTSYVFRIIPCTKLIRFLWILSKRCSWSLVKYLQQILDLSYTYCLHETLSRVSSVLRFWGFMWFESLYEDFFSHCQYWNISSIIRFQCTVCAFQQVIFSSVILEEENEEIKIWNNEDQKPKHGPKFMPDYLLGKDVCNHGKPLYVRKFQ